MLVRSRPSTLGFTALELMVALLIVAVIAAVAVPSMQPAMGRSFDRSASLQLEQVHRLGWSNATSERRVGLVYTDFADPTPGSLTLAGEGGTVPSSTYGRVSAGVYGDGAQVALAMRSRSGDCVGLFADGRDVLFSGRLNASSAALCTADRVLDEVVGASYEHNGRTVTREELVNYVPPSMAPALVAPVLSTRQTIEAGQPVVRLSWTTGEAPGGVTGYQIERDGADLEELDRTALDFTDTTVVTGVSYLYTVTPLGASDAGPTSAPVTVSVQTYRKPQVVVNGESPSLAELRVQVGWSAGDAPGGVAGYQVWRDGVNLTPTPLPPSTLRYTDTAVAVGPDYSYQVVALGNDGGSTTSDPTLGFAEVTYELTVPVLSVTQQLGRINSVSWSSSSTAFGPPSYTLYMRTTPAPTSGCQSTTGWTALTTTASTSYSHTNLTYGTNYRYCVRATDQRPRDPKVRNSAVLSYTLIDIDPPPVPTITSQHRGIHQMGVSWATVTDHSGPVRYEVYRMNGTASCATSGTRTYNSTTAVTSTTSPLAVPAGTLNADTRICVRAVDARGNASAMTSVILRAHTFTALVSSQAGSSIQFICGIRSGDLTAWCWGSTSATPGIPGMGTGNVWAPIRTTSGSNPLANIRRLAISPTTQCAIVNASSSTNGQVYCKGRPRHDDTEDYNSLGRNTLLSATPVTNTALVSNSGSGSARNTAYDISAGNNFACMLVRHGDVTDQLTSAGVWCWGRNNNGQVGNGTRGATTGTRRPVRVSGTTTAAGETWNTNVQSSNDHTCSQRTTGTGNVECWGAGSYGRKGDNTTSASGTKTFVCRTTGDCQSDSTRRLTGVHGGDAFTRINLGPITTCSRMRATDPVTSAGRIACSGAGFFGRTELYEQFNYTAIISSTYASTTTPSLQHQTTGASFCSVRDGGTVRCGGNNAAGQLGRGSLTAASGSGVTVTRASDNATMTGVTTVVMTTNTCTSAAACRDLTATRTHLRTSDGRVWIVSGSPYRAREMTVWMPQ